MRHDIREALSRRVRLALYLAGVATAIGLVVAAGEPPGVLAVFLPVEQSLGILFLAMLMQVLLWTALAMAMRDYRKGKVTLLGLAAASVVLVVLSVVSFMLVRSGLEYTWHEEIERSRVAAPKPSSMPRVEGERNTAPETPAGPAAEGVDSPGQDAP